VADVQIQAEEEVESGWVFTVRIAGRGTDSPVELTLTLSWADYDHWSRGMEPPSTLAREVIEFVLSRREASDLPARFDAATVRRWIPEIDAVLRRAR